MTTINYENNSKLTLTKISNNKINIVYKDSDNKCYEDKSDKEDLEDLYNTKTLDDFITLVNNNKPMILKGENQEEMILTIKGKLKLILKLNKSAPPPTYDLLSELEQMKKIYADKINKANDKKEELRKKNKELKEKIDEEKRKNDEIVRIYLINRQKYEEAVIRNNKIKEFERKMNE